MTTEDTLNSLIEQGGNSSVEFKSSAVRPEGLAREIVAFSNGSGGTILIGVEDNGQITGTREREDLEEWVANVARNNVIPAINPQVYPVQYKEQTLFVVEVTRGQDKPYQTIDGKFWIRVGSTNRMATKEELSRLFQQAGLIHFDTAPLEETSQPDLDSTKLQEYWSDYYNIDYLKLEDTEQIRLLINADIMVKSENNIQVSVGGMLIFGKQPQRKLPQSSIQFAVFNGTELTDELLDKHEIKGTLPEIIQQTKAKIETFLPNPSTIRGMKRDEQKAIPGKVLREAIVNAVCHRDYSISNRKISVYLFKDRIEVASPGRLPNTLNIEKILTGNSAPRNHFLMKYLDNLKFIDGLGRGVPMIKQEMEERFSYQEDGEMLRLILRYNQHSTRFKSQSLF